jgi:hypothetical protein
MAQEDGKHISHSFPEVRDALLCVDMHCPNGAAKSYARAGLNNWRIQDEHGLRVQCLYVLSNTNYWRGELAREVKKVLRGF